jgi:hypothetical protein
MSSLIACFVDASEVATAEEARPRFPPCPKTHGYSSRHSVEQIGGARPYINRGAQRRRLRRCGPRTITANGTGAGQERWIIIDMDSCGDEFAWEFGNAEAGLEASCRTDAFFWAEEAVPQENALCIYPSTCPIPIRRTGWKHRNCRPPPVDFEALRGGDTGEERERSRRLRPQPTALASLAPPLAISEESSEVVSFVSRRIDSGRYSSRFPRGPPIRAPLWISGWFVVLEGV